MVTRNPVTTDGINLEGASWVVVEGFEVIGMPRNGIRAVLGDHVTIRGNTTTDNFDRGIFTGFVDDLLIEGNDTSGDLLSGNIVLSRHPWPTSASPPAPRRRRWCWPTTP